MPPAVHEGPEAIVRLVALAARTARRVASVVWTRRTPLLLMAASAMAFLCVYLIDPLDHFLPTCRFHQLTGYSCPSCGLTRSLSALAHGHLQAALTFHPLGPGLALVFLGLNVLCARAVLFRRRLLPNLRRLPCRVPSRLAAGLGLALWIGLWIARLVSEASAAASMISVD